VTASSGAADDSRLVKVFAALCAPLVRNPKAGLAGVALALSAVAGIGLVFRGQPLLGVVAVLLLPATYLLFRWPESAVSAVAFILYTNASVVAVRFHGAPYFVAAVFPLLLCLPIARNLLLRSERLLIPRAFPYVFAFFVIQLLGALFAIRPEEAMQNLLMNASEGLVLYLLMANAIRSPRVLQQVISTLLLAGTLIGGLVLYQQLTHTYDNDYGGFAQVREDSEGFDTGQDDLEGDVRQPRLSGPIGEKNRFAQVMALLVPIAMFQYLAARSLRGQLGAVAALVMILVGCALGFSRGAAVGLAMMFAVMVWMGHVRLRHMGLALFGVLSVAILVPQYATRLATLGDVASLAAGDTMVANTDGATQGRITEMVTAGLVFADHPILGVGPGMFEHHYVEYARIAGGRVRGHTRQAHSLIPGIAAEDGILGLGAFLAVIYVSLRELDAARRRWQGLRPDLAHVATGLLLCIVVYLTTSVFLHAAYIRYFWFVLGLSAAASHLVAGEERSDLATLVRRV
jgi:putative inorganic carbon (HCO3(-)) transporter